MFFNTSYSAALAALLAEHNLGYIELVPQNPFAKELKEGIISAFRAGDRTHFDQDWWVSTFNASSRSVQLNFVALGLNELGHRPILEGVWPRVRNPMVLNNIEKSSTRPRDTLSSGTENVFSFASLAFRWLTGA